MTLFLVRLEPETGIFHYAGAGHLAVVLDVKGEVRIELQPSYPPLNVVADFASSIPLVERLAPGETLLLFTDGIPESHSPASYTDAFGEHRLLDSIREHYQLSSEELARLVIEAARDFASPDSPEDDVTIVVAKRSAE